MELIKSIYRKYFFKYTTWGKAGWQPHQMKDYYWEGN